MKNLVFLPFIQVNTPDWIERGARFYMALSNGDFSSTYQKYHPGATLMWVVGLSEKLFYRFQQIFYGYRVNVFSPVSYMGFLQFTGAILFIIYFSLILFCFFSLKRFLGRTFAFFVCFFMLFEPFVFFFVTSMGPDALLTGFMFSAVVGFWAFALDKSYRSYRIYLVLTGVFTGLALLTKISSLVLFPFYAVASIGTVPPPAGGLVEGRSRIKSYLTVLLILMLVSFLTFVVLFPAMWVNPVGTISRIVNEGLIQAPLTDYAGALINSQNIFVLKLLSYPAVLLFRMSPVLTVFMLLGGIFYIRKDGGNTRIKSFLALILIFSLVYLVPISISDKKIYKYILPLFIFASCFGAYGVKRAIDLLTFSRLKRLFGLLVAGSSFIYLLYVYPDFLLVYNPVIGGRVAAQKILTPDYETSGFYEAADYLNNNLKLAAGTRVSTYASTSFDSLVRAKVTDFRLDYSPDYVLLPFGKGNLVVADMECYRIIRNFEDRDIRYLSLYERICPKD